MKTIGLVGGITWHSSLDYYRIINEQINTMLGEDNTAKIILYSINYGEIKKLTHEENWDQIINIICHAAKKIEQAGADCLLIGANTMHKIADEVQSSINIPLIHIADATAKEIKKKNISTIALLGTKYTMQFNFFRDKLAEYEIETIIPGEEDVQMVNDSIYNELAKGIILSQTKQNYLHLINKLIEQGAEGIILGCTEIPLLIKQQDCSVPVFDTTYIHAMAAVNFALSEEKVFYL